MVSARGRRCDGPCDDRLANYWQYLISGMVVADRTSARCLWCVSHQRSDNLPMPIFETILIPIGCGKPKEFTRDCVMHGKAQTPTLRVHVHVM